MKLQGIFIFYFVNCELITQQVFQNTKGLQQLKLVSTLSQNLEQDFKYTLTLKVINDDKPILLVCDSLPQFSDSSHFDDVIQKYNCLTDKLNSEHESTQSVTISIDDISSLMRENFHVYQLSSINPFIGAYSKNLATYQISLSQIPNQECAKQCQNDGKCLNGYCQCQLGFFYDDCSIQGILLNDLQQLLPQIIYYMPTNHTTSFQIILSESVEYFQICIATNPNLESQITTYLNNINIPQSIFSDCESYTDELSQQTHFQIFGAIVIQILSDNPVFLQSPLQDSNTNNNTIALSVSIPFCVIIIFCVCCVCIIKQRKQKEEIKKEENNEVKTLIDIYMPVQLYNSTGQPNERACIICLEVFRHNTEVRVTYCQHMYHSSCLTMWMKKHQNCPICRQSLDPKALEEIFTQGNAGSKEMIKPLKITILQSFDQTQKIQSQYPSSSII